jgi:hypothetical protein
MRAILERSHWIRQSRVDVSGETTTTSSPSEVASRNHRQGSTGAGVKDQPELGQGSGDAVLSSIIRSTTASGGAGRTRTCDRRIMSPIRRSLRTSGNARAPPMTWRFRNRAVPTVSGRFEVRRGAIAGANVGTSDCTRNHRHERNQHEREVLRRPLRLRDALSHEGLSLTQGRPSGRSRPLQRGRHAIAPPLCRGAGGM